MKTITLVLSAACVAMASSGAAAHDFSLGALKVGHPWTRSTVPGQPTGGAFLSVQNTGATPDRLVGASTPLADHVEMHRMSLEGDVMRMRELPAIDLPAGQTVALQPGQLHLMLIGLKQPLQADAMVPLTLKFEKAGELKVELKVQALAPSTQAPASHAH